MDTSTTHTGRRLYKSRTNRIIDGICGGVGEYFDVDPTIVRVLWVLVTLLGGSGLLLYLAAMVIMPANSAYVPSSVSPSTTRIDKKRFWGIMLILVGAFILLANLGLLAAFSWWHLSWEVFFPILLIALGAWLVYVQMRNRGDVAAAPIEGLSGNAAQNSSQIPRERELRRSLTNKKLFGVCAGIANYFDIDPAIVRILFVGLVLATIGWALLLYILLVLIMPEEKPVINPS